MRTELVNGRRLLCGCILPVEKIHPGQQWAPASGGNYTVTVVEVVGEWVTYEGERQPRHAKDFFSFQCRYCLVLDGPDIPQELTA